MQESDNEENNGDTPYLIPPEEQDRSCAFRIPTRVLAKRSSKVPRRKSPRLSQASYNSARTTRNSKERVNKNISVLMKEKGTDSNDKVSRAIRKLEASFNPDASGILSQVESRHGNQERPQVKESIVESNTIEKN